MNWMLDARSRDSNAGSSGKSTAASTHIDNHSNLLNASKNVGDLVAVKRAVISVSNKSGLSELGAELAKHKVKVIATEGSAENLNSVPNLDLVGLSKYTEFPENFNGRLKTLHPKIQAGVLAIKKHHDAALKKAKAEYIDLVVVNLYPFEETVRAGSSPEACIENIDIGGPALIRGGAKNHPSVCVICDPNDYLMLEKELDDNQGSTTLAFRRRCAQKAFELTSKYDAAIAEWFRLQI